MSAPVVAAIAIGFAGVVLLSDPPQVGAGRRRAEFNRATVLRLASGLVFSLSAVGYRGASTALEGGVFLRAAFTLQTAALVKALGQIELVVTFLASALNLTKRASLPQGCRHRPPCRLGRGDLRRRNGRLGQA